MTGTGQGLRTRLMELDKAQRRRWGTGYLVLVGTCVGNEYPQSLWRLFMLIGYILEGYVSFRGGILRVQIGVRISTCEFATHCIGLNSSVISLGKSD